jgi:hypothetical protein
MNQLRRRVNAAVNPWSTAASRWWCHSALRHLLTGYGPTARQRRIMSRGTPGIRHGTPGIRPEMSGTGSTPSAQQKTEQMKARAKAVDDLLGRHDL